MKLNTLQKTLLLIIIMILVIIIPKYSFAVPKRAPVEGGGTATLSPSQITGNSDIELETDFIDKITDFVSKIGAFIAVGVLMVIGIKYMTGSLEEKATYKKSMIPYIIGCFLLFGASILAPKIGDLFSDLGKNTEEIGNNILGIIQAAGSLIAVGVLMLLGLKYLVGSVEEKATYKKTLIPYTVGAILLFAAVNLTSVVYNVSTGIYSGRNAANGYLNGVTNGYSNKTPEEKAQIKEQIQAEYDMAVEKRNEAAKKDPEGDDFKYWQDYAYQIYETLKWL